MSDQPQYVETAKQRLSSPRPAITFFYCPGESQPINRALHLARLERCYPKCRGCEHCEDVGPVSERRARGIRTILFEAEPIVTDRFVLTGVESELTDTARFKRWAARFGLLLRRHRPDRFSDEQEDEQGVEEQSVEEQSVEEQSVEEQGVEEAGEEQEEGRGEEKKGTGSFCRNSPKGAQHKKCLSPFSPSGQQGKRSQSPHVVLADASSRAMPAFVAAVCDGLRWAGCDVTDLGRGAVGLLDFAKDRLNADASLLLSQSRQWEHECGLSLESFLDFDGDFGKSNARAAIGLNAEPETLDAPAAFDALLSDLNRPTRQLGRLHRASLTDLYEKSFASRYHALRPLRIAIYTSCVPVVDVLRRLTAPFDVQLEVFPFSVVLRKAEAVELFGAHFSVYLDGTGRVVELLDEQGVPFFNVDDLATDAVEVITAIQTLLSRNDTPLSELVFPTSYHNHQ